MIRYDPYTDRFVDTDKATEVITTDRTICENPYFGKVQQIETQWKPKQKTNADRIRAMTDEELAVFLSQTEEHLFTGNLWSIKTWNEWLKTEVDG